MELYLVHSGQKVFVGESEQEGLEQVALPYCFKLTKAAEIKSFFFPVGGQMGELIQILSIVPKRDEPTDVMVRGELIIKLNDSDEITKLYRGFRAEVAGITLETNLSSAKKLVQ